MVWYDGMMVLWYGMVWFNGMVWYGLTTRVELWPGVGNSNHSEFQRAIYPLSQAYSEAAASNLFPQLFFYILNLCSCLRRIAYKVFVTDGD